MIQFYLPDIESLPCLDPVESGHCVRVLRKREGDEIICVDGRGHRFSCTLVEAHPKHTLLQIDGVTDVPDPWRGGITLAIAPTKNMDRMEWVAEKATEMGVNKIIPVRCMRSERKDLKRERLEKITVSAMKQSLKARLPKLEEMTPLTEVLKRDFAGQKFICYCGDECIRRELCREYIPGSDAVILIGPEGDFSPEEVKLALEMEWIPVSLGDSRMRTETAAIFSLAAIHAINQREA